MEESAKTKTGRQRKRSTHKKQSKREEKDEKRNGHGVIVKDNRRRRGERSLPLLQKVHCPNITDPVNGEGPWTKTRSGQSDA